jgi:hypothetical protein
MRKTVLFFSAGLAAFWGYSSAEEDAAGPKAGVVCSQL